MSYSLIPGVRQDHRGRLYQVGRYPNGKTIVVPYSSDIEQRPLRFLLAHWWTLEPGQHVKPEPCMMRCSVCK